MCYQMLGKSDVSLWEADAVFLLRAIIECSVEVSKVMHLCFIDYMGAFNELEHVYMLEMLAEVQVDGRDLRLTENICWKQHAAMGIDIMVGWCRPVGRGVQRMCGVSGPFFRVW